MEGELVVPDRSPKIPRYVSVVDPDSGWEKIRIQDILDEQSG